MLKMLKIKDIIRRFLLKVRGIILLNLLKIKDLSFYLSNISPIERNKIQQSTNKNDKIDGIIKYLLYICTNKSRQDSIYRRNRKMQGNRKTLTRRTK